MHPRAFPRYAAEIEVTLTHDDAAARGTTANLSKGGLCAVVDHGFPIGAQVRMGLTLVFSNDAASEPLELDARVVWSTALEDGFQVGVSFVALDADQRQYLDLFLRYLSGEE